MPKPDPDRALSAYDGASAAHELERCLLSLAECLRRGEEPDQLTLSRGRLLSIRHRLDALIGHAIGDDEMVAEAARQMLGRASA